MTITGIDAAKSKEGEIVFRTEPPMTEEVLEELANVWILGNEFGIDGELLVWRGAYPERSLRQQTDIFLTEAENAVGAKKPGETKRPKKTRQPRKTKPPGETKQHQEFLKRVSEQTGLPLV
jgi:hypothetical protein